MKAQQEVEKLFLFCMGELKLLIENPCEHAALLERLTAIQHTVERLYEHIVLNER